MKSFFRHLGAAGFSVSVAVSLAAFSQENAPSPAPPAQPPSRYFEGMGRTPEENRALEEVSSALRSYEEASREFKKEVQLLIEKKYEEKRNALSNSYEKAIRDLEVLERKERLDAIAQFEEFIKRYPNDLKYTPDVMFRLAELHYERASDEHIVAMRQFEERLKTIDDQKDAPLPPEPKVNFERSIAIYQRMLSAFPQYRLSDAVYYLLAYCQEKQDQFDQGRLAYRELITRYPSSRFATEAWVRIGEYYFDAYNEEDALNKAAQAYEAAIKDSNHPLYDKALYKLGWTYYRMDRFDEAVDRFFLLADYYQSKANKDSGEVGGDLRNEALQYAAISFADEKWGSLQKAKDKFQKLGGRAYEGEIYRRLGDVYFDQTRHMDAIESLRLMLEKDPLNRDAPLVQQRIVQAYDRDRKMQEAFTEAARLGEMFKPGTAWHDKHKRDVDLIAATAELAEKNISSSAIFHHQQALVYKQEKKLEQARASFETAAVAYGAYLSRFPRSKTAYEMQFYHAECLYNSFQFPEAAKNYLSVRDSKLDSKYQVDSAFSLVLSLQKQLEQDIQSRKLPDLKVRKSSERAEGEAIAVTPLTETEKAVVAASDWFVNKLPKDERSSGIAYKAAELYFVHDDFEEARRRFEQIVQLYPTSEVARYATNLLVESFLVTKDWESVERVAGRLASNQDVIDPKSDLFKTLVKFKLGGRFNRASEMMAAGQFEAAAAKYVELVGEEPTHEFADKALNNAAVCFESARRFDSALKLYERIYTEYPKSSLADAALFRVAVNAENSYDFDKAVSSYQKLVKEYPASKDRESALFNTARLLEGQQRYDEAANTFMRYAELFPKAEDAPKNQLRAALIYEKQGEWNKAIRTFNEFVARFSNEPEQTEFVFDARRRIADSLKKLGRAADANRAYESVVAEFNKKRLKPETSPIAADAAAQSCFQVAEEEFKAFDSLKIGGSGKALEKSFTNKRQGVKKVTEAYGRCFQFKRLEWTLASLYRRGFVLERFAQTIIETPIPPEIQKLGDEAVVMYQDGLAQQTTVLEEKAVENYAATLAEAKKNRLANEWTKKTLESLNRFRPKEYPLLKEARSLLATQPLYPDGLVATPTGTAAPADRVEGAKP